MVALGVPFGGCRAARFLAGRGGKPGRWLLGANYQVEADAWPAERAWTVPRALGILAGDQAFGPAHLLGVLPVPNDGIIALDETPLLGAADYRVVRANHVSLTFSAEAIRQTAHFLAQGRFAPVAADEPRRRE